MTWYNMITLFLYSFTFPQEQICFHLNLVALTSQHGEPGAVVVDIQPVDSVVTLVLKQILSTYEARSIEEPNLRHTVSQKSMLDCLVLVFARRCNMYP